MGAFSNTFSRSLGSIGLKLIDDESILDAILTEDEQFYLITEDEQFYLQLEVIGD